MIMGINRYIMSALFFLLIQMNCFSSEETLFERRMSNEEAQHFTVTTREEEIPVSCRTMERVKSRFMTQLTSKYAVKFVLISDDVSGRPTRAVITARIVKAAAVLYETGLPEEVVALYELTTVDGPWVPQDMPLDEIKVQFGPAYWDKEWGVQRVELSFDGAYEGQYDKKPRLRVTRLDYRKPRLTEAEKKQEEDWKAATKARLGLGRDREGFKCMRTEIRMQRRGHPFFSQLDPAPRGDIGERFERGPDAEVLARITECSNDTRPDYEFLRLIVDVLGKGGIDKFKVRKLAPGYVLVSEWEGIVAYMSGNYIVYLQYGFCSSEDAAKLYAKELPSTLPKNMTIDKTKWSHDEAESLLARMKANVDITEPQPVDLFNLNYRAFLEKVPPLNMEENAFHAGVQKKRELYDQLTNWWQQNKAKLVYDKDEARLMLKR